MNLGLLCLGDRSGNKPQANGGQRLKRQAGGGRQDIDIRTSLAGPEKKGALVEESGQKK